MGTLVLIEKRDARCGRSDEPPSVCMLKGHQPAIIRIFPNRQPQARRAPRRHHFFIASLPLLQPAKQIENQGLHHWIAHQSLLLFHYSLPRANRRILPLRLKGTKRQLFPRTIDNPPTS